MGKTFKDDNYDFTYGKNDRRDKCRIKFYSTQIATDMLRLFNPTFPDASVILQISSSEYKIPSRRTLTKVKSRFPLFRDKYY